jgi:hypothetical protein
MGYGRVSKVQITDNTITLSVDLEDFDVGALVEISGTATQNNGAVATFYGVKAMPASSGGVATVPVESAVKPDTFDAEATVTVVARAAAVWINTLDPDPDQPPAAWKLRPNGDGPALYRSPQQP